MLHALSLLRAGSRNGTFLSRFRACADPGFVVQKGLCSVHAEAGRGDGFCVVNVKLTIGLVLAEGLLRCSASDLSAGPNGWITRRRRTNRSLARGGVGTKVLDPCVGWPNSIKGGLSQSPPFFGPLYLPSHGPGCSSHSLDLAQCGGRGLSSKCFDLATSDSDEDRYDDRRLRSRVFR